MGRLIRKVAKYGPIVYPLIKKFMRKRKGRY